MEDPVTNVSETKILELNAEFLDLKFYLSIYLPTFSIHQVAKI